MVLFTEFTGIRACADEGAIFALSQAVCREQRQDQSIEDRTARNAYAMDCVAGGIAEPLRKYLQRVHVPSATEGDEQNTLLLIPATALLPRCPTTVAAQ
jgi:hypothetical protein